MFNRGQPHKIFATIKLSLRIYKNEYRGRQLNFIRKNFHVLDETETIIRVAADQETIETLMQGMFTTDEQFKALFPAYQTEKECQEWTENELARMKREIATTLCGIINDGDINNPMFAIFRSFYLNELA